MVGELVKILHVEYGQMPLNSSLLLLVTFLKEYYIKIRAA